MDSIIWALLLFLAQLHTLLYTSTVHVDAGNLTHQPVPFLCRPDQAEVLLRLKESLFDTFTTILPSWRDSTDCCLWEGVDCDISSGNVTVLDLNNRGFFSYGLDPVIFNLTSLRRLDLSMNNFNLGYSELSNLPATGFERFTLLTHLNLSNSGFRGQIPIGIRKLVNLVSLDLSSSIDNDDDNLFSEIQPNFDTLVSNLSNLRELRLDGVDMSSSGEDWCVALAKSVPLLQLLSLGKCRLRGPIHESLSSLRSLVVINLEGNEFPAGPFPEFLMDFPSVTVLQLSNINLEGWFPTKSFQSGDLRVLDLSWNRNLSGHLPNLSNVSSLETLRLEGTNFSYARPTSSSNFKLLKELSLDGNLDSMDFLSSPGKLGSLRRLNLFGFDSVIEPGSNFSWIGEHKTLKSLELDGCNFSMASPSLASNFVSLRSLTMIECDIPTTTFSALGNLMDLQALKIERCITDGPIPSSIGNLTNLRDIYIRSSGFSGPLPAALGNLTNLETLAFFDSGFSEAVPDAIGKLGKLTRLYLDGCKFSGRIPSSIVNLTRLKELSISSNRLSGEIPSSIFTLPVLQDLDLSDNLLSGPIRVFDNVSSELEFVILSSNELSGSIPKVFFRLTSLRLLDVSSNNLTGSVDLTSFWRLRLLISLDLSNNKLSVTEGENINPLSTTNLPRLIELALASCNINQFPKSLALMNQILYLDLSCNKIIGDVPSFIWETLTNSLAYLNLSHNMLTSMQLTSDILPFTHVLKTLDLSFNGLKGRIPMPRSSSLVLDYSNNRFSSLLPNWAYYLTNTIYLSMSNNSIDGHIPLSICNSSMLEVLDVSHNNFSGLVPSCLIENGQLGVLNLRGNQFDGTLSSNIVTTCSFQTIDLHGNNIEGQLPRGLSNCQQLEVLDFGSNRIVDIFPSWLRGLPRLTVIILRSNKFYGTIRDAVGNIKHEQFFPSLKIIDLSSNDFSGNLRPQWIERLNSMMEKLNITGDTIAPSNFSRSRLYHDSVEIMYKGSEMTIVKILTTLTTIDFSNNRLEGTLPESIGRLVSLRLLNLSHNAFTGKIPAQLGGMTDLESLDLSSNQLSGTIPQELTSLTFLAILNLSDNHLVGKIPQSRQFSTFGSSSFDGNIGLCGPPVSELPCGALPNTPAVTNERRSSHHVDVVLFLFVGLGFGVGFAAAIVVEWGQLGRWLNAAARALQT